MDLCLPTASDKRSSHVHVHSPVTNDGADIVCCVMTFWRWLLHWSFSLSVVHSNQCKFSLFFKISFPGCSYFHPGFCYQQYSQSWRFISVPYILYVFDCLKLLLFNAISRTTWTHSCNLLRLWSGGEATKLVNEWVEALHHSVLFTDKWNLFVCCRNGLIPFRPSSRPRKRRSVSQMTLASTQRRFSLTLVIRGRSDSSTTAAVINISTSAIDQMITCNVKGVIHCEKSAVLLGCTKPLKFLSDYCLIDHCFQQKKAVKTHNCLPNNKHQAKLGTSRWRKWSVQQRKGKIFPSGDGPDQMAPDGSVSDSY